MKKLFALSLLCAVFTGVTTRAQTQDSSVSIYIQGNVYDAETLNRLHSAYVSFDSSVFVKTDGSGFYRIGLQLPGQYKIMVRKDGYWTSTVEKKITSSISHLNYYLYNINAK